MIDLTKKYTYQGYEVIDIYHYSESISKLKYLVVIKSKVNGASSWWIAEDDPKLIEVKPEPAKVTRWFNVYENGEGFRLNGIYGYSSETTALNNVQKKGSLGLKHIKTISIEVEIPVEDE